MLKKQKQWNNENNSIFFLTSTFLFANCNIFKTIKLIKQGEIEQKQFKVQIPFENRAGLIVLKVKINEIEHDFLFDTGAPTVLSEKLFKKLNLKVKAVQKTTDSQVTSSHELLRF